MVSKFDHRKFMSICLRPLAEHRRDRATEFSAYDQIDSNPPELPIYLFDNEGTPGSISRFDQETNRSLYGYFGAATVAQVESSSKRSIAICRHAAKVKAKRKRENND